MLVARIVNSYRAAVWNDRLETEGYVSRGILRSNALSSRDCILAAAYARVGTGEEKDIGYLTLRNEKREEKFMQPGNASGKVRAGR